MSLKLGAGVTLLGILGCIGLISIRRGKSRGASLQAPEIRGYCERHSKEENIRLNRELYQEKGQPFSISICTHKSVPLLSRFGELIFESIMKGTLREASDLMAVCVMPDHVHFLLAPISENLVDLIGKWKGYTTHLIWKDGYKGKVWQRSFYDHALRKEEDIIKVAEYIVFNPVRKELVRTWEDYPYSWHQWIHDGRPRRAATTDWNS